MSNATLTPRLYMAFGSPPLSDSPVWTEIEGRLRGAKMDRHRGDEGTCDLILDNRDRGLEPEYTGSPYYPDVIPNVRVRLDAVWPATGNLLDHDTSSGETGFGLVVPDRGGGSPLVTRSTEQAADGAWSFALTGSGAGFAWVQAGLATPLGAVPVVAGQTYTAVASFRAKTTTRTCRVRLYWLTVTGASAGAEVVGSTITETSTGWTQAFATGVAPIGTTMALIVADTAVSATPAVGEVHYVDKFGLSAGSSTAWVHGVPPTTTLYDGYIDSITPSYIFGADGGDALVSVRCTDLTKMLARYRLRGPYESVVAADAPLHWWRLGEASEQTVMADSGSSPTHGTYTGMAEPGAAPVLAASSQPSLLLRRGGLAGEATFPEVSGQWSVSFLLRDAKYEATPAGSGLDVLNFVGHGGNHFIFASLVEIVEVGDLLADAGLTGRARLDVRITGPSSTPVDLSIYILTPIPTRVHIVRTATHYLVYVNGSEVVNVASAMNVRPHHLRLAQTGPAGMSVLLADVAVYDYALTSAQVTEQSEAAVRPWQGDSTGERVERVLDLVGVPADRRDVDAGITSALDAVIEPIEGATALELVRVAEETEAGRMFVTADGVWRFADRRDLDGVDPVVTFGDGGGAEIPYGDLIADYDEKDIVRSSTVTRQGGNPQTYTDPTAGVGDPIFAVNRSSLLYATDGEAFDRAVWDVTQNKDPHLRYRQITLQGERSLAVMRQVAAREIGDKVTVKRRPPGGGSPQERTVVIEGVSHTIDLQARSWRATYDLGPIDTTTYWALDSSTASVLGTSTVLAF